MVNDKIPSDKNEEIFFENDEISDDTTDIEFDEESEIASGDQEIKEGEVLPSGLDEDGSTEIVGIRFKKNGKTYYFSPAGFKLGQDDRVIVDTSRGDEYGYTAVPNREIRNKDIKEPLRSVIRLATDEDTEIHKENLRKEIEAFNTCIALIDKHKLEMKLVDVEMSFDRTKLIFYFSAEGRIDFRELVKDLAGVFHLRIEMRQIGIRDEAKILGGLGICGRPYCCATFLCDFGQVSVKMAKEQNLSLNSAKISGACGRLMCCLRYEYDTYLAEKALTPKVDTRVVTPSGAGVVTAANPLAGVVKVKLDKSGEDDADVLFVREDVVSEELYDGRPLTKTVIPDKTDKSQQGFEAPKIISEVMEQVKQDEPKQEIKKEDTPKKAQEEAQPDKENRNEGEKTQRYKNKKNDRRNNGRGHGADKNKHQQKPAVNKKNKAENEIRDNVSASDIEADGSQQNKNDTPKKKKPFKPYYRNFKKKKKLSGNGESSK